MQEKVMYDKIGVEPFEKRLTDEIKHTADIKVLQINLGNLCNLSCKHCHIEAGPEGKNVMNRETVDELVRLNKKFLFKTVDITGGAPEMNPNYKYLVENMRKYSDRIITRTNLIILLEEEYKDYIDFFKENKLEVVCSLPHFIESEVDRVRGGGVFEHSIEALKRLNASGYGKSEGLILNLVYNPSGAFFPPKQSSIEKEYKIKLYEKYKIEFNNLYALSNNPSGRFANFLKKSGNFETYMQALQSKFNENTLENLMCRYQISVSYDGYIYDCDFNQSQGIKVRGEESVKSLLKKDSLKRDINFSYHCYACSAGQGSACSGAMEK